MKWAGGLIAASVLDPCQRDCVKLNCALSGISITMYLDTRVQAFHRQSLHSRRVQITSGYSLARNPYPMGALRVVPDRS